MGKKKPPGIAVSDFRSSLLDERFCLSPTLAQVHYHGPGGLNGRLSNENGLTPPVRLWRLTMKPISRLSLLVGERSNPDQIFKLEIEDAEGKPSSKHFR